ncbi:tetratricopeptide repeat-containing sensor histidine kinase [Lutimonas zeaxanthinifaciens]|uniref:tetratricopeptide repeat-containing sensor histidine kinase n=1 Tax=Lutimonas zeaxanthinifaciens TaxID=3060215 RepID=UPI00265CA679|nr:tetratricopeptide repeat-containing sensor histidine kinase [Lutimonas sp. YSD2104]WKK67482.1 tetratricopeptide repeat protein [Lutimonas sp. YSD2104]
MNKLLQRLSILWLLLVVVSCENQTDSTATENLIQDVSNYSKIEKLPSKTTKDFRTGIDMMNKTLKVAQEENNDSLQLLIYRRKSFFLYRLNSLDSSKTVSYHHKRLALNLNDKVHLESSYKRLAAIHGKLNQLDSSLYYYGECKKILEANNDSIKIAERLLNMAIILQEHGNNAESLKLSVEGLGFLKSRKDPETEASFYNNIAIIAKGERNYPEALYWYEKALKTTPNRGNRLTYLSNVANIYRLLGDFERSNELNEQALEDDLIKNDNSNRIRILSNLSFSKWLSTKHIEFEEDLLDLLSLSRKEQYTDRQINIHQKLALIYAQSDPKKEKYHTEQFYLLARESNQMDERLDGLKTLINHREVNSEEARAYTSEYLYLKDSIDVSQNLLANSYAKYKFDSDANRKELASLKVKELENQLELRKSKQKNTIYIGLGVISILGFIIVIVTIRNNYQKEKVKEVYRTETRISKKLHDEVANDIYQVMNQLNKAESKPIDIIDNLEQIYTKTRDISRENNELEVENDFEESLTDLLMAYKNEDVNVITKGIKQIKWSEIDNLKKRGLYRVLQELMTNMTKHSRADLVVISFKKASKKIEVIYKDNGVGCELAKNNGLLNVENRINSLKGQVNLVSSTGKGFKASIKV